MTSPAYTDWKNQVATHILNACGLSPDDLPDIDYASLFDAGCTPIEAAEETLANADAPDLMLMFLQDPDHLDIDPDDLPF